MIEKIKLKEDYEYWFFSEQEDFFEQADTFLKNGYQITDHVCLGVEFAKNQHYYFLTYQKLDQVNLDFKKVYQRMLPFYKLVLPNYNHCMLNSIASIRAYFHRQSEYQTDPKLDAILKEQQYQNIVIVLLDGLGENVLEYHLKQQDFLKQHHSDTHTAIFPSTTAAATTSIISGLSPLETGWLGWENYFKELDQNIILFNGKNYFTEEQTSLNGYLTMPYQPFFADLEVCGKLVMPTFKEEEDVFSVFDKSLVSFDPTKPNIQYVYCTEPDTTMHEFGTYSKEARACIEKLNQKIEQYVQKLPPHTLCVITADHGHTSVQPIELWKFQTLQNMLVRKPANDSRAITFTVQKECHQQFVTLFQTFFGDIYDIYPSSELIARGFFGPASHFMHARVPEFLGDFMAIAKSGYYFNYKRKPTEQDFIMKSHHAGYTADEMLVPIIVYRK